MNTTPIGQLADELSDMIIAGWCDMQEEAGLDQPVILLPPGYLAGLYQAAQRGD